jgi:LPS O-antigen subunit length determinant protein (WzzB/FepE family)
MKPDFEKLEWHEALQNIYRRRISILAVSLIVAVITAAVTLFIPNQYEATANLLPNQQRSVGFSLFAEGTGLQSLASTVLGGQSEEANRFYVLLNSYSIKKRVIDQFQLLEVYEVADSKHPIIDAMGILEKRTNFEAHQEGNFTIHVRDHDPDRAKAMADFYVEVLNELNIEIATREAASYRAFIEDRYTKSEQDLRTLRDEFSEFQRKYGVFQLEEQVIQYFNLLGQLTIQQFESEIKLDYLRQTVQPESQAFRQAQIEYDLVTQRLNAVYSDTSSDNFILNFGDLSDVGLTYFELMMRIEIESEIQKFIIPLLEQARMEEVKSLPIVSVVDQPVVPEKKSFPPRSVIVILAAFTAFVLTATWFTIKMSYSKNQKWIDSITSQS